MVDIFTKFTQVVPVKTKHDHDIIPAMKECFKLMRKLPKSMYMDSEGGFVSKDTKDYLDLSLIHI